MTTTDVKVDLDAPIWDQNTFTGRLKYFAWMTDFRNSMVKTSTLYAARDLLQAVR